MYSFEENASIHTGRFLLPENRWLNGEQNGQPAHRDL